MVQEDYQIQTMFVAICLIIFGVHMNILFIIKVKIPVFMNARLLVFGGLHFKELPLKVDGD